MAKKFEVDDVCTALGVEKAEYRGTGSFGETWRADFAGRDAAYKIIHNTGDDAKRLSREVEGYRRIDNAHVVKLFDVRTFHIAGMDRPVMIFEYIPGCDLSELIKVRRPSHDELRGLARGLLTGVRALHEADLLHRDLKPANIALRDSKYDDAVILDLGLAKLLDVESITRYPTLLGTTFYMAPEQLRQDRALRASDLWAIGEMLFEAATGVHPFFKQGEAMGIAEAVTRLSTPPAVPSDLPPDIAELILKCLSDVPHRRGTVTKALDRLA
ncbi:MULTISPECIES: serine/threonine-protein kinase [Rhodococcus]|uniref:serine/threonine-protein kinase n=1 Tax=Rhodococcus TaxID=1827 RepID=UPI0006420A9F|nr:serine/threonine-protein kinase [Rhodococcus qingshengii]KLN71602.1 hypothetical protein ABM90_11195 [Rhodococcus erythropolis]KSU59987.1 hypothetical protein AS032_34425 [Rhodococcus qingshengii]NHP18700.1 serine/threonine protein kinase [Rhodococcus sp. IC4_135]SCC70481.1 Protein kinase domain-containing protein [Rhodococcus qingshengii]